MMTIPRFFGSSIFVVAIIAETFGIMLFIFMTTFVNFINFFAKLVDVYFFLSVFLNYSLHYSLVVGILGLS
jgi:hypothetical protein